MARSSRQPGDGDAEPGGGDATPGASPPTTRKTFAVVWEQISTLLLAVAIALAIRGLVVEPFRIPSGSMLPTLLIGDHLFVSKLSYGPRIPFTDWRLPGLREPRRGDVVVFEVARGDGRRFHPSMIFPADEYPDLPRDDFVKRLVGLPGDRIAVEDGNVWVNGELLVASDAGSFRDEETGRSLKVRSEQLFDCRHAVLDDPVVRRGPARREFVVPPDRYFMMGDNRDHSNDSREWGTVRLQEMKGPAFLLYWSWDVNGNALQFFNPVNWWSAEKRWSRVFQRVRCDSTVAGAGG
jgi:signal peptidase I